MIGDNNNGEDQLSTGLSASICSPFLFVCVLQWRLKAGEELHTKWDMENANIKK